MVNGWLRISLSVTAGAFLFFIKQENILNMEDNNKYKDELIIEMRAFSRLGELIPMLEATEYPKEMVYEMIERHINLLKDAFQNYKNPPKYGIKGKLIKH